MFYLSLSIVLLKFWYLEAPLGLIKFFLSFNKSVLQLISLPVLIKTYFKPWKNEYRKGLVLFSIGMGIFIKSFVIVAELLIFSLILIAELLIFLGFLSWPFATLILLIQSI
jgi:hypothetical protein